MPAQISGLLDRLKARTSEFTVAQRTIALIGIAGLVLGLFAVSAWLTRPSMSPLFANLGSSDASAIVDHLQSEGVPYELTDGGSTILVPNQHLYTMRLAVAAAGLPAAADGSGYSLLDDMGMTSSEFQQQVTYQRALEGEMAKTISALNGVENATVRLALPSQSVFVSEQADPTASVFVQTARGGALGNDQVQSIVHLVSAGIEGMSPQDVAVIDADGRVLSAVGTGGTALQEGQTSDYEQRVAAGIQAMLDPLVGRGNAVVTVTADLDYDQVARTTETYVPDADVPPLSSSTTVEEYTGTGGTGAGVLGPDNIAVPNGAENSGEYRKESETVNNALSRVTEQTTTAPGSVRRQAVSVVISEQAGGGLNLAQLEEMVTAAAAVDVERGDVVAVTRMNFDTSGAEAAQEALAVAAQQAEVEQTAALIRNGIIAGAILLAFILAMIVAARRSRRARREAIDLGGLEIVEEREPEVLDVVEEAPALPAPSPIEVDEMAAKREDIIALAADQPAEVAEALRGWLAGSRR
ncbi:flagellar basal-body MS-ring/collar protein FliF [Cellulomonas bogoriensis]|uniref:Flagellar M-ring protein n=1 Tax=Cellulomonas bogoriensis 69B4 = DSM 16987 TaxID=1386082 RepID=A0A0A0BQP4_9CELL|nr:flagellar basal-body MS-ring/collar protein FliF [Cellulomonas bogoriensis]KGM10235.1 flagellar M-ring protein FliF [Cellulomonas bogoriensis 69B4 = DSM 16987]